MVETGRDVNKLGRKKQRPEEMRRNGKKEMQSRRRKDKKMRPDEKEKER